MREVDIPMYVKGKKIGVSKIEQGLIDIVDFKGDCHEFILQRAKNVLLIDTIKYGTFDELKKMYSLINNYNDLEKGDIILFTGKGFGLRASNSAEYMGYSEKGPIFLSKFGKSGRVLITDDITIFNRYQNLHEIYKLKGKQYNQQLKQ